MLATDRCFCSLAVIMLRMFLLGEELPFFFSLSHTNAKDRKKLSTLLKLQRSLWKPSMPNSLWQRPITLGACCSNSKEEGQNQKHKLCPLSLSQIKERERERELKLDAASLIHSPGFSFTPGPSPPHLPFPLLSPQAENFVTLTFNYIKSCSLYPLWMSNCSAISIKRHRKYENRRQDLEQDCS